MKPFRVEQRPESQNPRKLDICWPDSESSPGMCRYTEDALKTLRNWAKGFVSDEAFDSVFLEGSLLEDGGAMFNPKKSDVDIILRYSEKLSTPVQRAKACEGALRQLKQLECTLQEILERKPQNGCIIGVLPVTHFEIDNDIHKMPSPDGAFFSRHKFLELAVDTSIPRSFDLVAPKDFRYSCSAALELLALAQKFRTKFLEINLKDRASASASDQHEMLDKNICRALAQLKHFADDGAEQEDEFDLGRGIQSAIDLIKRWAKHNAGYEGLTEWLGHAIRQPQTTEHLSLTQLLLIWETLAQDTIDKILEKREQTFLRASKEQKSIKLGDLALECKMFPNSFWAADRESHLFEDDPESANQILIQQSGIRLPDQLLQKLLSETKTKLENHAQGIEIVEAEMLTVLKHVDSRLTKEGSNAYPRLAALPTLSLGEVSTLRIFVAPSRYGIALVEERKLQLPTALVLRSKYILNSLGIRVAFVFRKDGNLWLEFHQRKGLHNSLYEKSWDVAAAGYVDPDRHGDPDNKNRISVWQACAHELAEELGISAVNLPFRDHFHFFGLGRNDEAGYVDVLGFCESAFAPDANRAATPRVRQFDRCQLNPEAVAAFVGEKRRWIPTALLTLVLTLEAHGFSKEQIESAFSPLVGRLDLTP